MFLLGTLITISSVIFRREHSPLFQSWNICKFLCIQYLQNLILISETYRVMMHAGSLDRTKDAEELLEAQPRATLACFFRVIYKTSCVHHNYMMPAQLKISVNCYIILPPEKILVKRSSLYPRFGGRLLLSLIVPHCRLCCKYRRCGNRPFSIY